MISNTILFSRAIGGAVRLVGAGLLSVSRLGLGALVLGTSSTGLTGSTVDALPVVVGDTVLETDGVLLGVGLRALALGAGSNTLGGGVDVLVIRRGDLGRLC